MDTCYVNPSLSSLSDDTQTLKGNRSEFQSQQNGLKSILQSTISKLSEQLMLSIKRFLHAREALFYTHYV